MKRVLEYIIPPEFNNRKISDFLKSKGFSARTLTSLRHTDMSILLNQKDVHMNQIVHESDKISVILTEDPSERVLPVDIQLDILYEDQDIIVIDKPANMPSHPSRANYENTLGNAVAYHCLRSGNPIVFRCINRLDKDTSGLTIIAKNVLAAGILHNQRADLTLKRTYTALVTGHLMPPTGTIDLPIERISPDSTLRGVDMVNGKRAVTHYEVIKHLDEPVPMSLVKLNLDTGRTHQIRVHMAHIGHPLIGDNLYNPGDNTLPHHALHAGHLEFNHPITGEHMIFDSVFKCEIC